MSRFLEVALDIADLLFEAEEHKRPLDLRAEARRIVTTHRSSGVSLEAVEETLLSEYATLRPSAHHQA